MNISKPPEDASKRCHAGVPNPDKSAFHRVIGCPNKATATCAGCGKPVCAKHKRHTLKSHLCEAKRG